MLLTKTTNSTSVTTFKLISGEEIITRVHEDNVDHYILNKPMCLVPGPNGGLGLAPMLFSVDAKEYVRLNKTAIALQAPTVGEISTQYLTQTTGIAIANTI